MPMNLRDIHYEDTDDNRRKLIEYLTKSTNVTDVERLEKALEKIK